jgi:hypothetical protein
VSSGNFQPPEVRPIPDSPNLQVCLVFIPHTEPYAYLFLFAIYSSMFCQHFPGQKNHWALILLYLHLDYLYCIFFWFFFSLSRLVTEKSYLSLGLSVKSCPPYLLLLLQCEQFRR